MKIIDRLMDNDNTQSSCSPPRVCQRHGPHVRHLLQIVLLPNQLRDLRIAPLPFHMLPQKFSPQWTQTRQSLIKPTNESWVMKENRGGGGKRGRSYEHSCRWMGGLPQRLGAGPSPFSFPLKQPE